MGGVGKTTMMRRLRNVVHEKKMFNFIVEAVIGEHTDPIAIQDAIADYLGVMLSEKTKSARADKLRHGFNDKSDGGKNKFLVILDDVWQSIDMEDIGLSPLPNQGVNFKVLLTSRDRHVCTIMGVDGNSIFNVKLLTEAESQSLFWRFVDRSDPELHNIGEDIVRKCCHLPIAIKTMACTLRDKSKDAWKDALSRLERHENDNIASKVFETSYENLPDEETKSTFLICGLFPEDFNIPIEELLWYGWGLKSFKKVYTIREARIRLNTCIEQLVQTNLLMEVDNDVRFIKMHDLVRAFVLDMFSKVEHASFVNHGDRLEWPTDDMHESCKRVSLTCKSMCEFPRDLKFPNLTILKLMNDGDTSLRFPQDFYEGMRKIQVIAFNDIKYPLLPSSPQWSTNLRVLHLHECSLRMFDFSCVGNLLNLEVLSFADCDIEWLPSTIGNLKKLRLLDLSDCDGLRIEQGVLKNLVKLEELYMGFHDQFRHQFQRRHLRHRPREIIMTNDNCNEIEELSKGLCAIEFQFFRNNVQLKNMSFEKLERFKISVGCYFDVDYPKSTTTIQNVLKLSASKVEILDSRLNELFEKTEMLCLQVQDMNDLGDIGMKSSHSPQLTSSFKNLRVLVVSKCIELRYLFTIGVVKDLSNLEHLEVDSCNIMEQVICNENDVKEKITFPKLKSLTLNRLPNLLGLCNNSNKIELLQLVNLEIYGIRNITSIYPKNNVEASCFFKGEVNDMVYDDTLLTVVSPKLEKLHIHSMKNLKEIWPNDLGTSGEVYLREMEVRYCDNIVNLFPCNPMSYLHHLEELHIEKCDSIKVLFNFDLDYISKIEVNKSGLRIIEVTDCDNLVNLFPCNPMSLLCHLEKLRVERCRSIEVLFEIDLDLVSEIGEGRNLRNIQMKKLGRLREVWRIKGADNSRLFINGFQATNLVALMEISIDECGGEIERFNGDEKQVNNVSFPQYVMHSFHNMHKLELMNCQEVDVVFEIESPKSRELVTPDKDNQQPLLPYLEELDIRYMEKMSHVWKCNWNKFLNRQRKQYVSAFHNLTTIYMYRCGSIKYLFSPLMAKLLSNLKKVRVEYCDGIEEVVSNRDDEDEENTTSISSQGDTTLFPSLDSLTLLNLASLKLIDGGGGQLWKNEVSFSNTTATTTSLDQLKSSQMGGISWTLSQYAREIQIDKCHTLSSGIPCSSTGQTQKLQVLKIESCNGMKEVFETQLGMNNHNGDSGFGNPRLKNVIKLPNLKILKISFCERLEHIFTFSTLESLRQLEELEIRFCNAVKVIVKNEEEEEEDVYGGQTTTNGASSKDVVAFPRKYSVEECALNFDVSNTTARHQTTSVSPCLATSEWRPWYIRNLVEIDMESIDDAGKKIIPSRELLQLQKLEKIHIRSCRSVEEVFETLEGGTNSISGFDESPTAIVKLSNLTQVDLERLDRLKSIWKGNQWTVFEFPNLTTLSIKYCDSLEHVFTISMVGSLLQLKELCIWVCKNMEEVIVKDTNVVVQIEDEDTDCKTNEIVFPRLKSLNIQNLLCLKAFCLEKVDFSFPLLDTLTIIKCPALTIFTKGNSAIPQLKAIETAFGSFYVGQDINSIIKIKQEEFKEGVSCCVM
ncbi:hypothetical protein LXL04_015210 [Taraxacum kok-saghyz]